VLHVLDFLHFAGKAEAAQEYLLQDSLSAILIFLYGSGIV
jgi:hypothetical protein